MRTSYELADAKMLVERGVNILAHNVRDREVDADFIDAGEAAQRDADPDLARDELLFVYGDAPAWIEDRSSSSSCRRSAWRC